MKKLIHVLAVLLLTAGFLLSCGDGAGDGLSEWEKYKNGINTGLPSQARVESFHLNYTNFSSRFTDPSTGYYGYSYTSSTFLGTLLTLHYMDFNETKANNLRNTIHTHTGVALTQSAIVTAFNLYESTYDSDGGKDYHCEFSHYFKGYKASNKLTFPASAGYATLGFWFW